MSPRDEFLKRVRDAVAEGNRAGVVPPLPERGNLGYQGAGTDPVARFQHEIAQVGGQCYLANNVAGAIAHIERIVREKNARKVLVGDGDIIELLDLKRALSGVEVTRVADLEAAHEKATFFEADIGISGVEHLIAETGTVVLATRRDQPRALSLLVPVHIAVARKAQLLPDLFDLFPQELPACLTLITGPSKTGDIELRLVTGVHGPGEMHVILCLADN
jgi:L-lactate utilization protein LutC